MELSVEYFDRVCRTCLSDSGNLKSLFTKLENGHQLLDLFIFSMNIDANSLDGLPKHVCGECEAFIHKAGEFRRRCLESDSVLKKLYQNNCDQYYSKDPEPKEEVKFDPCTEKTRFTGEELNKRDLLSLLSGSDTVIKKIDVANVKLDVKTEVPVFYDNNDFADDFDDREALILPEEIKQENSAVKTQKVFSKKSKSRAHLKVTNSNKKCVKKAEKTNIPIKNEMYCEKCDQKFKVLEWRSHQHNHHNVDVSVNQFQCSLCLRRFKTKKTLTRHIKRHETTDNIKHVCPKCKREFRYKSFLESHMLSVHPNSTDGYVCEYCPEIFSTKINLEAHKETHIKKKNVCPFCEKSFLMLCTLKDHLRIHTGEKPFLCSTCGKGFSQKTNLGQHIRRHMGVKPYKCDTCSKGFVSKGELDAHVRKHSGAHPFICDECGNGFTTSSALVKHRRTHTGERPYACDLCPMKFAATGTLKNHRRTHTGERPYQCSHCEKTFVQRSDMVSHIRCHTGERPFVCPQCGQSFRKAAAMKAHVKMHSREAQNVLQTGLTLNGLHCDQRINPV